MESSRKRHFRTPRRPSQAVIILRGNESNPEHYGDHQSKSFRDGDRAADLFSGRIPAPQLRPPPQQPWRTRELLVARFTPYSLERLRYQNQIAARRAGRDVAAQFLATALGPVPILKRLDHFLLEGTDAQPHALLRSAACSRNSRAIFRRAR